MDKQEYLSDVLLQAELGEYEGLQVTDLSDVPEGYKGEVLEVNDHGNVTLYRCFKNGNLREIASRV